MCTHSALAAAGCRLPSLATVTACLCVAVGTVTPSPAAAPVRIGAESAVPEHPRSLYNRCVNWRPADGERVTLNPPRFSWPYSADAPQPWRTAQHVFTLQIAPQPDFRQPVVDVTCNHNFYNLLPALATGRAWYWRVGYDIGTPKAVWSPVRSFTVAPDAATWDRAGLQGVADNPPPHPRILINPENLERLRSLATTDPGSRACLESMRRDADRIIAMDWWRTFPTDDTGTEPQRAFYQIAHDLALVCFVWKMTADDRYAGVKERAVTWAGYPPGGRSSPEGLGGDGSEDATQGNEFLTLLFDWLYQDLDAAQRQTMIKSLEWRVDHIMNRFSWGAGGGGAGPMLRLTFRPAAGRTETEAESRDQRLSLPRSADWRFFEWRIRTPEWAGGAAVEAFNYYAPGDVIWDSLSVQRRDGGPNLLANPDISRFANGAPADWRGGVYGTAATVQALPGGGRNGTGALLIRNPAATDRGAWNQNIDLPEERDLRISGWYRTVGGATGGAVSVGGLAGMIGSYQFEAAMDTAACGVSLLGHSDTGRQWFDLMLNYLIGVTVGHGFDEAWNEGAGYGTSKCKWLVNASLYYDTAIPGAHLGRNPVYSRLGEFFRRIIPVGMTHHAWGNQANASRGNHLAHFRKLAYFTGDGRFLSNWREYGGDLFSNFRPWIEYALPAHYPEPAPDVDADPVGFFPIAGWAMAATGAPGVRDTFANGLGVIFQCRTRGAYGHSFNSDGSFQLHAYGEMINHGGGSSANKDAYAYHSMSHNLVLIDGLGQAQPNNVQTVPTYGRLAGFARGDDYVHVAGDTTRCYPASPDNYSRWGLPLGAVYRERALPHLNRAIRHIVFRKNSYVVIYDDLACSRPATYTWLYHIRPERPFTLRRDVAGADYAVGDVQVYVRHLHQPGQLEVVDRQGEDALVNPITGEDYREWRLGDILCGHTLWISNHTPAADWRFLTVVYPVRPESDHVPTIAALDPNTVTVDGDVICFDPASPHAAGAAIVVDPAAFRSR